MERRRFEGVDGVSLDRDPSEYRGRVTVDVDGYVSGFELTATRAYYNLARRADEVEVHVSSSGEGVHLVGWFREHIDFPTRLKMRRALCDDQNRIQFDLERFMNGIYTDVLWTQKDREHSPENAPEERPGKDRSFSDIHDALDHIKMNTTTDADRMNRLANYGHKGEPSLAAVAHGGEGR